MQLIPNPSQVDEIVIGLIDNGYLVSFYQVGDAKTIKIAVNDISEAVHTIHRLMVGEPLELPSRVIVLDNETVHKRLEDVLPTFDEDKKFQ